MRRLNVVLRLALAVVLAQLAWTWLERHDSDLRIRRLLAGRAGTSSGAPSAPSRSLITQFYARAGEIVAGERNVVCYGAPNAASLELEPPVEKLAPTLNRCFWIEPREDTTYRLTAQAADGSREEASFTVRVTPAPPVFRMVAVSDKAIPPGEVVTVCYNVEHASGVVLHPLGWRLPPGAKNCVRFYPKTTMDYTLIASGERGIQAREKFRVAVK